MLESRREKWAQAICDTSSAGRYLLPGRDVEFLPAFSDGGQLDIQAFLERLDGLGGGIELLAGAYWLSQPEVQSFVFQDLPILLKNLGHGSRSSPPSVETTFKGRVLWQETSMGRLSGAIPRGRYLVQHVEMSADIPENRLLKLLLTKILSTASEMSRRGNGALPQRFASIRDTVERALGNTYLKSVELEHRTSARMLTTARRHRDRRYSRLAQLAQDFDHAIVRGKWAQIIELLRKGWLAPISSDDLFELFTLILVMQIVEVELGFGEPYSYGLIQRGRHAVASYRHSAGHMRAEIFFDQVPSGVFGNASEYLDLVASHDGLTGQERRPDMILRFTNGVNERRVLIEVKETEDPVYIRDSTYKVIGYLRDFTTIWDELLEQFPKALVVFPTGINPKAAWGDIAMVSSDRRNDLAAALKAAIGDLELGSRKFVTP